MSKNFTEGVQLHLLGEEWLEECDLRAIASAKPTVTKALDQCIEKAIFSNTNHDYYMILKARARPT